MVSFKKNQLQYIKVVHVNNMGNYILIDHVSKLN